MRLSKDAPIELYDLHTDPADSQDVAAANPPVVKKLDGDLATARTHRSRRPIK
ncbi:MAG: hypothetical protein ABIX28_08070 [Vicinamibacterales bacterium]